MATWGNRRGLPCWDGKAAEKFASGNPRKTPNSKQRPEARELLSLLNSFFSLCISIVLELRERDSNFDHQKLKISNLHMCMAIPIVDRTYGFSISVLNGYHFLLNPWCYCFILNEASDPSRPVLSSWLSMAIQGIRQWSFNYLLFFTVDARGWTRDLWQVKQMLYHWIKAPSTIELLIPFLLKQLPLPKKGSPFITLNLINNKKQNYQIVLVPQKGDSNMDWTRVIYGWPASLHILLKLSSG